MELGIDLGSSNTVAFLRRDGGAPEQVLFDGSPLLPSAVFCDTDGALHVGRDALHHARSRPERLEANPKRRIDEGTVFLGQDVEVEQLFAALLRRVATEARRIGAQPVSRSTVSHPASWGQRRRDVLARAAAEADLGEVRMVSEPVAAAAFHLRRHLWTSPDTTDLLVYDLG
ncbi:MAG: Hsp70 family protein, partial [Catenulispora sp.]